MNLQYISDHKGEVTGVFIPIDEWEPLREKLDLPPVDKEPLAKQQHREELIEAFEQMREIRAGKAAKPSLNAFLNEIERLLSSSHLAFPETSQKAGKEIFFP